MSEQEDAVNQQEEKITPQDENVEGANPENGVQEDQPELTAEEKLAEEIEQAKLEMAAWKDKYMRLHAEFDNFRKRNARERIDLMKNAGSDVILDVVPVIDDFDRAIKANETNEDLGAVKEGFELIKQKLIKTLESKGLKPMNAIGQPFDTDLHEAITQIPAPSKKMRGKVVDVVEKGYFMNDTVLRYAKVVVGQ